MIFCPSRRIFHSRNSRIIYNPYFRNRMLVAMNRRLHIYNQIGSFTFWICITMKTGSQGSSQLSGNIIIGQPDFVIPRNSLFFFMRKTRTIA